MNMDADNGGSTGATAAAGISGSGVVTVGGGSAETSRSSSSSVGGNSFCEYRCQLGVSCASGSTACQNTIFVAGNFYCRFVSGCPNGRPPFSIIYIPFAPVFAEASRQPAASTSIAVPTTSASTTSTATTSASTTSGTTDTAAAASASASQISGPSITSGAIGISTSTIGPGSITISGTVVPNVPVASQVQVVSSTEVNLPAEVVEILGHVDFSTQATSGNPRRQSYPSLSVVTGG